MRIGSLFSGIGGLELGLERAIPGAHTVWQVEKDPFCLRVLAKHWPQTFRWNDVSTVGAHDYPYPRGIRPELQPVDLICGGFPCQDLSVAGKGEGLAGSRSGLWTHYRRIVDELRPRFVVVENVAHGRGRWLPFVRRDLEALGYRTRAYVLAASDVGAPHQRRRCFVIADADREPLRVGAERGSGGRADVVRGQGEGVALDESEAGGPSRTYRWGAFPDLPRVDDGLPDRLDRERALGNAVVPQVAEVIGRIVFQQSTAGSLRWVPSVLL